MRVHEQVLDVKLPFDERAVLEENAAFVQRMLGLQHFSVHTAEDAAAAAAEQNARIQDARPGTPIAVFSSS